MQKTKKALVISDMLKDFIERGGLLYCGDKTRKIIPFIKKLSNRFRRNNDLVIYANDTHKPDDKEFAFFGKHSVRGTRGSQVISELRPEKGDLIVAKTTYDAAFKTALVRILKTHRVKEIFLAGVCTSICIMETASSLTKLGFHVNVFKRGVADFDKKAHNFALKRMRFVYGAKII